MAAVRLSLDRVQEEAVVAFPSGIILPSRTTAHRQRLCPRQHSKTAP